MPLGELPPGALRVEDLRMRGEERREERAEVTCVTTTGPGEKVVSSSVGGEERGETADHGGRKW